MTRPSGCKAMQFFLKHTLPLLHKTVDTVFLDFFEARTARAHRFMWGRPAGGFVRRTESDDMELLFSSASGNTDRPNLAPRF